jgi:hypothetical protein
MYADPHTTISNNLIKFKENWSRQNMVRVQQCLPLTYIHVDKQTFGPLVSEKIEM